jgi:uncharacterized protein (TIGR02300 family)
MATTKDRGTKRTCQNGDCSARFYDLNRTPIVCPICGTKYTIAHSPVAGAAVAAELSGGKKEDTEENDEPRHKCGQNKQQMRASHRRHAEPFLRAI